MAKKKDRAFFICPRWNEVADTYRIGASGMTSPIHVHEKTLAAIKEGRPVARSTLRKALLAARQASGSCSMSMPTSWTSAPLSRGELSGAAPAGVALVCGGATLS